VAAENDSLNLNANRTTVILASDLLANDTGVTSISSVQNSEYGAVSLDGDGNVLFTPNADYYGPAIFSYTGFDSQGNSSTATVTIDVKATLDDGLVGGTQLTSPKQFDTIELANGKQVLLWERNGTVVSQDFDLDGNKGGVVHSLMGNLSWFRAAGLADGSYVVVGQSEINSQQTVYARFSASGTRIGTEKEMTIDDYAQSEPEVIALQDGGFVIVTHAQGANGSFDTFGRRFDSDGNAASDLFEIRTGTGDDMRANGVELADGRLMLFSITKNGTNRTISAQLFSGYGYALGSEHTVMSLTNPSGIGTTVNPYEVTPVRLNDGRVAITSFGKLYVYSTGPGDTIVEDLSVDYFNNVGDELIGSDLVSLSDGGVFVVYNRKFGSDYRVYGQRYDANGNPVNGEVDFEELDTGKEWKVRV